MAAKNILFVCTGNTCRSPMASQLLLNKLQQQGESMQATDIQVCSAGLFTYDGLPASAQAIEVMREEGIDISLHRSALLESSHIHDADLILTMTSSQRDILINRFPYKYLCVYTLGEFVGNEGAEVLDPYGQDLHTYRQCLGQLKLLVDRLVPKIIELDLR
ncbi:MAG: low molecular weight protein arginine phosphatase [Syntrophomonas sp.]|nr:low molecular weight protein arginine phosphatase [Syntrophomonas sp.]